MTAAAQTLPTEADLARLRALFEGSGISKTVYACVMPETEKVFDAVLDENRTLLHRMYRAAWRQGQDAAHETFFRAWKNWAAPVVSLGDKAFPFFYPTAGASEALRETVSAYGNEARARGFSPVIHVFDGDYEGFAAFSEVCGIPVVRHNRDIWRETLHRVGPRDQFYLSQPSALDGNVWEDFAEFADTLRARQPRAKIMLDLTYVGAVARPFTVDASSPNIAALFFSLSKPMGVYYHRIGGIVSRAAYPGLFGNKWFKNLLSLSFGTRLLETHGVFDLPRRYAPLQAMAAQRARETLGLDLVPSDVWLIAHGPAQRGLLAENLQRGPARTLRACLTPMIAESLGLDCPRERGAP